MDPDFTPIKTTYTEQVYDILEKRIIHGVLRPGQKLSASELAATLKVSRSPVREAIIALNHEGLVTNKRGNWSVAEASLNDVMESYEARKLIEGNSAKIGALVCISEILDQMRETIEELNNTDDNEVWWQKNNRFHELIVLSCGNKKFHDIHLWVMKGIRWCGLLSMASWKREQNNSEHDKILMKFMQKDQSGCENAIVDHLTAVQRVIAENWDKYKT